MKISAATKSNSASRDFTQSRSLQHITYTTTLRGRISTQEFSIWPLAMVLEKSSWIGCVT